MGCLKLSYYKRESTLAKEPVFLLKGREKNGNTEKIYKDYYPFGSIMPGRNYNASGYRFGFNGQEKDNEITGVTGTHYTAEFWEYDSRIGRRWNIDPMTPKYPWQSPYACFNNNPIYYSDPSGLEGDDPVKKGDTFIGKDGKTHIASCDEIEINGTTSEGRLPTADVIPKQDNSDLIKEVKQLGLVSLDATIKLLGGTTTQAIYSLAGLSTSGSISPMDVVPYPGVSYLGSKEMERIEESDKDVQKYIAGKGWEYMKSFAKKNNSNGNTSVIFVYAAADVHKGVFKTATSVVLSSPEEAEKTLGFVPTVVYYQFTDEGQDVSTNNKLQFK